MKISVNSTFSYITFNLNYGSALQCYAMQKVLKDRGHETALLRDYRANPIYILKRFQNIRYLKAFIEKAKAQIWLQRFIWRNIPLSKQWYLSYGGLKRNHPKVDCHIVGSDQVWHNANSFRYLTYVPDDKLKLSYAASFGRAAISHEMKELIKPYLARFDGITVREASGVEIIKSMGYDAKCVLDPTLLLDWEEYPYKENCKSGYCYCYFLNLSDKKDVSFDEIKKYSEERQCELLITAPLNYSLFLDEQHLFPSVEDWLGLYKNAECIFTNTYHGLLFSIIFRKQFLLFVQRGNAQAENERFYSILSILGLLGRIVCDENEQIIHQKMQTPIDYNAVYETIREKRRESEQFFELFGI